MLKFHKGQHEPVYFPDVNGLTLNHLTADSIKFSKQPRIQQATQPTEHPS